MEIDGPSGASLGVMNPLTYRGYVYDHETGLYYLQSRYYNPAIRQFISPDAFVSTDQGYLGYNMFAYCLNNPVNMVDVTGAACVAREDILGIYIPEREGSKVWRAIVNGYNWVNDNIKEPVGEFFGNVWEDASTLFNSSEERALNSNYFAFYKGTLVINSPNDDSFSFGFIVLGKDDRDADSLRHEYGHIRQMRWLGLAGYTLNVMLPSLMLYSLEEDLPYDYYSYPCEATANFLGGSNLTCGGEKLPVGTLFPYLRLIPLFFK